MDNEIVNDQFRVEDEVRDCMELFEKINDSLTASWELMYYYAQRYVEKNGDLDVPKRYYPGGILSWNMDPNPAAGSGWKDSRHFDRCPNRAS